MATYVNNLRLTELATGEGSGTWGTTTNTSLELIGEALGYNTQDCFSSDADATTTIADGATDPARAFYFKVTSSATLTATRTLTIAPNTISRVMFIENATTGSQSIAISQGSGANVTIATGKTAVIYLDGAGATAAVVDAMANVDPGVTDTLAEVLAAGNTSGGTGLTMSSGDDLTLTGASYNAVWDSSDSALEFGDNAKAVFGAGSDLQIYHNGSTSFIDDLGTGNLHIRTDGASIKLRTSANADMIVAENGGAAKLYHAGSQKLATLTTGIDVTGTVTADGLTVDAGSTSLVGTLQTTADNSSLVYADSSQTLILKNDDASGTARLKFLGTASESGSITFGGGVGATGDTFAVYPRVMAGGKAFNITGGGDISFYEDTGTTAKLFWDASAESLGIGTSSPVSQLQVNVGTNLNLGINEDSSTVRLSAYNDAASASVPMTINSSSTRFDISGSEAMRIDSSGNVGIGTSSPATALDVVGGVNSSHATFSGQAGRGLVISTENTLNNDDGVSYNAQTSSGKHLFKTNGTERMRIDSSGNVGIGTSSPSVDLDVDGQVAIGKSGNNSIGTETDLALYGNAIISSVNSLNLGVQSSGYMAFYTGLTSNTGGTAGGTERVRLTSDGLLNVNHSDITASSNALFNVANSDSSLWSAINTGANAYTAMPSEIAVMNTQDDTANSFGGIFFQGGETSSGLAINAARIGGIREGTGSTNTALAFAVRGTSGMVEAMRIDSSYQVGIGTSSPGQALSVESSSVGVTRVGITNTGNAAAGAGVQFITKNGATQVSNATLRTDNAGNFSIFTGTTSETERVRIDSNGNLLVGKTSAAVGTDGAQFLTSGYSGVSATSNTAFFANRNTADGDVVEIGKNGVKVGSIGVYSSRPYFANSAGDGVRISADTIAPSDASGADNDNHIDLGYGSNRWKNLYLSSIAKVGSSTIYVHADGPNAKVVFKNTTNTSGFDIGLLGGNTDDDAFIYNRNAGGNLIFGTANAEQARIDSSGRLLLNTTSARNSRELSIDGAINAGTATSTSGGVTLESYYTNGSLNSWGSVASSGGAAMCYGVHPKSGSQTTFTSSTGIALNRGAFVIDDNIKWYTGSNQTVTTGSDVTMPEKMRLTTNGDLLINDTTASAKLWVNKSDAGNTFGARATSSSYAATVGFFGADRNTTNGTFHYIDCYNYGSSTYRFRVADSGNVTNTNNSYGAISDIKLKENIVDATPKLDKLNEVRIVNYNFIGSDEKQLGVIAQELEQIMPNMVDDNVDKDEDGNELGTTTKTVKYSVFVPMLIKAMQEQTEIINDLRARVAQLEGEN